MPKHINQCLQSAITAHFNHPPIPPHFSAQSQDMCQGTISYGLIENPIPSGLPMGSLLENMSHYCNRTSQVFVSHYWKIGNPWHGVNMDWERILPLKNLW